MSRAIVLPPKLLDFGYERARGKELADVIFWREESFFSCRRPSFNTSQSSFILVAFSLTQDLLATFSLDCTTLDSLVTMLATILLFPLKVLLIALDLFVSWKCMPAFSSPRFILLQRAWSFIMRNASVYNRMLTHYTCLNVDYSHYIRMGGRCQETRYSNRIEVGSSEQ
jgi:hypothetical protein